MAVIRISDVKPYPSIIKITIGRGSELVRTNTLSIIYNKPMI